MQTKVLDGSSVRDCLRPRRAIGRFPVDTVLLGDVAALPSVGAAWLSGAVVVCSDPAFCCGEEPVAVDWLWWVPLSPSPTLSLAMDLLVAFFPAMRFLTFILLGEASSKKLATRDSGRDGR